MPKKTIGARELFLSLVKERAETGRIYIMNIDHCNSHISSSQFLCRCLTSVRRLHSQLNPLHTLMMKKVKFHCVSYLLSMLVRFVTLRNLKNYVISAVRALDELIDYQGYPVKAAERATKSTPFSWYRCSLDLPTTSPNMVNTMMILQLSHPLHELD